jgi:type I restriction enzyme S subunit
MNRIDELIKKLCPNGVEYKKASEIKIESFWLMPSTPTYIEEGVPYITSKNIKNGKINFENVNYISEKDYISISSNRTIKKNDLLITMIGTIGETAFVEEDIKFYGQNMYLIRLNEKVINRKFFNYYLTSEKIKNSLVSRKNTSSQGYIKAGSIENLLLPVPPLEVQCEIVHILDDFTLLSAELSVELSAELKARQKQYEYYKEVLLENNEAKKIKLNSCLLNVENIKWKQTNENYVYIDLSSVDRERHRIINTNEINKTNAPSRAQQIVKTDDILFGGTRPMLKRSCIVENKFNNGICSTGFCVLRANKKIVNPKWIYFMISTNNFYNYVEQNQKGASYPAISDCIVKEYMITLPSLEEQEKIINLLDKFETYINDILECLPAEIEARKKQYEYYRDKLLAFEEEKNNG